MKIQEKQLVLVKIGSFRAWLRVNFIDLDNTFLGKIELVDKDCRFEIGEILKMEIKDVIEIFSPDDGRDWCYSDNMTRCTCPGLCRNK